MGIEAETYEQQLIEPCHLSYMDDNGHVHDFKHLVGDGNENDEIRSVLNLASHMNYVTA